MPTVRTRYAAPAMMRRADKTLIVLAVCLLALSCASGCAKSNTARWAQARDALTVAQDSVVSAHQAGAISDRDLVALDPFVQAARAALARAQELLPAGGSAFDFYMNAALNALDNFHSNRLKAVKQPKAVSHV